MCGNKEYTSSHPLKRERFSLSQSERVESSSTNHATAACTKHFRDCMFHGFSVGECLYTCGHKRMGKVARISNIRTRGKVPAGAANPNLHFGLVELDPPLCKTKDLFQRGGR